MVTEDSSVNAKQLTSLFGALKIRKVELWGMGTRTAGVSTVEFSWEGFQGPETLISDTGNTQEPAHIVTKPPKASNAFEWFNVNSTLTDDLFAVRMSAGDVIDVHVSFTLLNGFGQVTLVAANATPSGANGVFFGSLDYDFALIPPTSRHWSNN